MAYVYIIQDLVSNRFYVGSCVDLEQRILRHKKHTGGRTTKTGDWELVCYTVVESIEDARKLEKLVKSYKGGNAFRKIILREDKKWTHEKIYKIA